ncbi:MAG: efflux RND transporter periplasmic adaptor subunit [Victivallaceae bacterium]|nr:efflux RND transporter periplasmic adaptor subunit [Victivallaceae bacterium]
MKMQLLYLFLMLCSGSAVFAAAPNRGMPKSVVELGKVTEAEDFMTRRYTGQVVTPSTVRIVPRVSGESLEVGFKDGSYVKKGQVLYKLDATQYQAAVKSCEAKIAESKAKLEYATHNYQRTNTLYEKSAASRDTMENTKATMEAARAGLLAAEAELISAKDNLKNATIVSPIDGMASVTSQSAGNYITPSTGTLVTIVQIRPMRVRFAMSSSDLFSQFKSYDDLIHNTRVRVRFAGGAMHSEEGAIELINNEANSKTDSVALYAWFPNKDYRLLVGSTVNVTVSKKVGRKVPAVPPSAVMHDSKGAYVYVTDAKGLVERRYVVCGNVSGDLQLIEKGLSKGETVVVKGTHKTMPGGSVEVAGGK